MPYLECADSKSSVTSSSVLPSTVWPTGKGEGKSNQFELVHQVYLSTFAANKTRNICIDVDRFYKQMYTFDFSFPLLLVQPISSTKVA